MQSRTKPWVVAHINGLGQKRRNSIAYAMELRLFYTHPLMWVYFISLTEIYCMICMTWRHDASGHGHGQMDDLLTQNGGECNVM